MDMCEGAYGLCVSERKRVKSEPSELSLIWLGRAANGNHYDFLSPNIFGVELFHLFTCLYMRWLCAYMRMRAHLFLLLIDFLVGARTHARCA